MLSNSVQSIINDQIKHELASAYLYLAMSARFETKNLGGCAHWMRIQAQEELSHAMKFFDYVNDQGGQVTLQAFDQPPAQPDSPLAIFQAVLAHEQKVTGLINSMVALANKENDYATQNMLQWFVNEQIEEEKSATQIVEELKLVGDSGASLFLVDRQLAARGRG